MSVKTSSGPNDLRTPSALTSGSAILLTCRIRAARRQRPCERPTARTIGAELRAAREPFLDEVLSDREHGGHEQVPDTGDHEKWDLQVVAPVDQLGGPGQIE